MTRIILVGGGEHACVVADAVRCARDAAAVIGFVDPKSGTFAERAGIPRLGDDDALGAYADALVVIGFGSLDSWKARWRMAERLAAAGRTGAVVVHRASCVAEGVSVGEGSVVMAGALVQPGAVIGRHCVINTGSIVEHDVVLGDNVHVATGAAIGGGARIGDGAFVGLRAAIRDHVTVGGGAVVGMGAVVVRDVAPGSRVMGVPAR